eukprot:CAMPEP_0177399576 /NCGR_PEP_ID=MMETSP0368-20130122/58561_1 /TAXON_ID=447022 ORGANISM="Scrippsiella hangoei-like, Strain SHHI-4" /NCGR_SAMPLE_ID=MMETSP0368 /ASSEMBLY_ACC=CAM_ASM_000363 /LENGTH=105 /DNA_ID=CAMNT_0018866841 /DNA_START=57 /DNA_END=371 /DNA_ORIENTATION=+
MAPRVAAACGDENAAPVVENLNTVQEQAKVQEPKKQARDRKRKSPEGAPALDEEEATAPAPAPAAKRLRVAASAAAARAAAWPRQGASSLRAGARAGANGIWSNT